MRDSRSCIGFAVMDTRVFSPLRCARLDWSAREAVDVAWFYPARHVKPWRKNVMLHGRIGVPRRPYHGSPSAHLSETSFSQGLDLTIADRKLKSGWVPLRENESAEQKDCGSTATS
jgi:hypothetical protein